MAKTSHLQHSFLQLPRQRFMLRLLALLLLITAAAGCHPGREYEAALVLADIAAGAGPSRLKSITGEPRRTIVTFSVHGRATEGDLYLTDRKPLAAVLLLPGAAEKGREDPRLQAFARSLSRARFAVLVPDLEGFRSLKVSSADIPETAEAFSYLVSRADLAPAGRAGMFSFSYASGPAILAALEPSISSRVKFIMAVGGYHSLKDVLTFFTTGYFRQGDAWRYREPNSYGKWVFILSNLHRLSDPGDRQLFRQAALRKLSDLNASVRDVAPRLTPEGKRLYDFIENGDPARARFLMRQLPEAMRREIDALDVAEHDLRALSARLILVHGYDDDIIPYRESIALKNSVPRGQARLYLVHGLQHVNLKPRLIDKFRLWRAIAALMREKEER